MKSAAQRAGGFTLVEIMIVIAIIGILATVAVQNYSRSREVAFKTTCIHNLQQIEGAVAQWALETKKDTGEPVGFADIKRYLQRSVVCPSGGTSFEDSYTLVAVDTPPACQRRPESHKLPGS